jgi:hypothetical protein
LRRRRVWKHIGIRAGKWLIERAPASELEAVVSAVCGIHAQVATAAELSIAARVDGLARADVRRALAEERRLVKTWSVRGTLHLHPARELPLWMAARRAADEPRSYGEFGISRAQADELRDAIGDALRGRCLTREELGDEVAARVGEWATAETSVIQFGKPALVWPQLLGEAATSGALCFGPPRGNRVTFVRADEWVEWREEDPAAALAEVARRYLAAYGPATTGEFAHWFHAPRERVEAVWPGDVSGGSEDPVPLRLLPAYECYVIGAAPPGPKRERLVGAAGERVFDRGAGPHPVPLADGVVAGLWKHRLARRHVDLFLEPLRKLSRVERAALDGEAARIGAFLGLGPRLHVGS